MTRMKLVSLDLKQFDAMITKSNESNFSNMLNLMITNNTKIANCIRQRNINGKLEILQNYVQHIQIVIAKKADLREYPHTSRRTRFLSPNGQSSNTKDTMDIDSGDNGDCLLQNTKVDNVSETIF